MCRLSTVLFVGLVLLVATPSADESKCRVYNNNAFENFKDCIQRIESWDICDKYCPYEDGSFPEEGSSASNPFTDFEPPAGIWVPSPAELYLRGRLMGSPDRLGNPQMQFDSSGGQ